MASNQQAASEGKKRHVHEGPKNHVLAFLLSIVLTALAFFVVMADMGKTFTIAFILVLGFIQALFQLAVWMHMKDRGHGYAIVGLIFGFVIAVTGFAAVLFWIWW